MFPLDGVWLVAANDCPASMDEEEVGGAVFGPAENRQGGVVPKKGTTVLVRRLSDDPQKDMGMCAGQPCLMGVPGTRRHAAVLCQAGGHGTAGRVRQALGNPDGSTVSMHSLHAASLGMVGSTGLDELLVQQVWGQRGAGGCWYADGLWQHRLWVGASSELWQPGADDGRSVAMQHVHALGEGGQAQVKGGFMPSGSSSNTSDDAVIRSRRRRFSQSLEGLSASAAMMTSRVFVWRLCQRHQKVKSSCDHDLGKKKVRVGCGLVLLPLQQPQECHHGTNHRLTVCHHNGHLSHTHQLMGGW